MTKDSLLTAIRIMNKAVDQDPDTIIWEIATAIEKARKTIVQLPLGTITYHL